MRSHRRPTVRSSDLAIVGMGCRFPGCPTPAAFWRSLVAGQTHVREVDERRFGVPFAAPRDAVGGSHARHLASLEAVGRDGCLEGWRGDRYGLAPKRTSALDPQQALLLDVAREALEDAGATSRTFDRRDAAVYIGASTVEHRILATGRLFATRLLRGAFGPIEAADTEWARAAVEALPVVDAYTMVGNLGNFLASSLAQAFDLGGPALTVDAACASSLAALQHAALALRAGVCVTALVGGAYIACVPDNLVAFGHIGAISRAGRGRPFDRDADGFVLGEGVGVVVVKLAERAVAEGDRIYAVVRGVGASSDGRAGAPMTPSEEGQRRALERAYRDAEVDPGSVGYVEAHGTATPTGDLVEVASLGSLGLTNTGLGAVKANIGHGMSAAGIASLIKAALVLHRREIPPLAGYEREREELELARRGLYVPRQRQPFAPRSGEPLRAGVSAFGFGGANVHAVLEAAP